jgi:hypothetical protein
MTTTYKYDVVLSFAGEDRRQAEALARAMQDLRLSVFYDKDEQADLLGKDFYQYSQTLYRDAARYCVILISRHYVAKKWPLHELRQAQARAFRADEEYIIPVRLDDTELPGLNDTVIYQDLRRTDVASVARLLHTKLAKAASAVGAPPGAGKIRRPWWRRSPRLAILAILLLLATMSLGVTFYWNSVSGSATGVDAGNRAVSDEPTSQPAPEPPGPKKQDTTNPVVRKGPEPGTQPPESREPPLPPFRNTDIVANVFAGRLDAVTYDERYAKNYLAHMAGEIRKRCPALFSHDDIDRLNADADGKTIDLSTSEKDRTVGFYRLMVLKKTDEAGVASSMAGDAKALDDDAKTDAGALVTRYGCDSPALATFARHLRAYLNTPRLSAGELVAACESAAAARRMSDRMCICLVAVLSDIPLSRTNRHALGTDFWAASQPLMAADASHYIPCTSSGS